jgi:hypothetical protein
MFSSEFSPKGDTGVGGGEYPKIGVGFGGEFIQAGE